MQQYRTDYDPLPYPSTATNASRADIEIATNYTMGYVEFDDQGWLFNHRQIDAITNEFSKEMQTNGLLMVVYMHGWKHNADSQDDNVAMFHKHILATVGRHRKCSRPTPTNSKRRIVGVYVGWRGLSDEVPLVDNISFWNRKTTAERVGHGAVVELFSAIGRSQEPKQPEKHRTRLTRVKRPNSKLFILGHSFGGDIVFSATAPDFDRANGPEPSGAGTNTMLLLKGWAI